ncbi:glycoside hydrolase family 9 protein [Prolixibacteraceae bacterium Z1-6]|uniref:Glycoside hydrolase family 9 protein n=1 Tax=Draconibacterium aestuarii TaxID=2998507 RepID=A0A9X3F697_9BACT|nr:glycoside hydrolase family 9 protein [Prolixibacteraceae bacterium Z1-6]
MKRILAVLLLCLTFISSRAVDLIRINQLGYLPKSIKVAVFLSSEEISETGFTVHEALTDKVVYVGKTQPSNAQNWGMGSAYRLNFSELELDGGYYIKVGNTRSPNFRINSDVYEGTADFILNYLRQQRCGYNPYLKDSCHLHDGIIVDHPTKSGEIINVTGGWHDASDYLQYSTTSVNTVFQMMFAYHNHPEIYGDAYKANGEKGSNGTPDILDEIRWGLEWMLKMNPAPNEMYNQIADDRDHVGFRLPNKDTADYGLGKYRPVYFVTGQPQGLAEFKNQSTGVSSIAGKFASGFALGAQLFEAIDADFSAQLKEKVLDVWNFALSDTGFCQTACNVSPYFYEERNYEDDLELGATQLYELTGERHFLDEAIYWGKKEEVSPWMRNGTARHYESYPFINLGHYFLAKNENPNFVDNYKTGLNFLFERGKNDPFFNGLPFIWCSNNLVAAAITQANLYEKISGNTEFAEMEAALRDWLFGCNPWGTTMICGLPGVEDSPMYPHSSITVLNNETTYGGLIDGPVYNSIYTGLIGISLTQPDKYAAFNKGKAVYHDDIGDYSTNEPTMDGTASLSYLLADIENKGREQKVNSSNFEKDKFGTIIRIQPEAKNIYLCFTADSMFEGGDHVLKTLKKNKIKASFFFTGNFLRLSAEKERIEKTIRAGHYVGAHSDKHLLYCSWNKRDSTLVSQNEFEVDIKNNFSELEKFGIKSNDAVFFMPPYEWYNQDIADWSKNMGLNLINFTPGTGTNADYTTPDMSNYKSSEELWNHLKHIEESNKNGLNGVILLIHPGTSEKRTDKFYLKLDEIISYLSAKGYEFKSLKE